MATNQTAKDKGTGTLTSAQIAYAKKRATKRKKEWVKKNEIRKDNKI